MHCIPAFWLDNEHCIKIMTKTMKIMTITYAKFSIAVKFWPISLTIYHYRWFGIGFSHCIHCFRLKIIDCVISIAQKGGRWTWTKENHFKYVLLLNLFYLFCFDLIAKGNEGRKRIKRYPSIEEVRVYVF